MKYKDYNYSTGTRSYGSGFQKNVTENERGVYIENNGIVITPHFPVNAFGNYYKNNSGKINQSTFLSIYFDGRCYVRRFKKYYSSRYMVTLGKRFSAEVFAQCVRKG